MVRVVITSAPFVLLFSLLCVAGLGHADDLINLQTETYVKVPDTGQVRCYDTNKEIYCPSPGKPFYGQDGSYSINAQEHQLIKQDGAEIVLDKITGLDWQRTPDPEQRTWREAIDYTDGLQLAGYTDWRLPNKQELLSILSYGQSPSPLLEPSTLKTEEYFTLQHYSVWTLTTRVFPSLTAKAINLKDQQGTVSNKYEKKYVYAVRGSSLSYGNFTNNRNGTITDQTTGLTWLSIEILPKSWEQALAYCEQLKIGGFTDWRLPTIKELSTLVDEQRVSPSINTTFFPSTRSGPYWTSTTFAQHPGFAWYIQFNNGLEYNGGYKGRKYFVRPVRGGTIATFKPKPSPVPRPVPQETLLPLPNETRQHEPALPDRKNMGRLEPYPLDVQQYE